MQYSKGPRAEVLTNRKRSEGGEERRPLALNLWFVLEDLVEEDEKFRFR